MFRELTRKKQELSREECIAVLTEEKRGVLSVLGDGDYPYGMPMNHFYNADDGCIYFHCGKSGHRTDALRRHGKVSFCVYDAGQTVERDWFLRFRSVIVFGRMELVDDPEAVTEMTRRLCKKFTQDEEYIRREIENFASKTILLKLSPEHMCGKRVTEA